MTDARHIAEALGLKGSRRGFYGSCPACGYSTGFVLDHRDGKILTHCHAGGCGFDEIRDSLIHLGVWGKSGFQSRPAAIVATTATKRSGKGFQEGSVATHCNQRLWQESLPAKNTVVEQYLRGRGITLLPDLIRFLPEAWHSPSRSRHPVMLAGAFLAGNPEPVAVHRTYLKPDGSGKADIHPNKMSLGPVKRAAVPLATPGETLAVAEGIETALSVLEDTGIPTWAALSCGGIKALLLPALPEAREIYLFADHDRPGLEAAYGAAEIWTSAGRQVRVVVPPILGEDFNDVLKKRAS